MLIKNSRFLKLLFVANCFILFPINALSVKNYTIVKTNNKDRELYDAITNNNVKKVKDLINKRVNINQKFYFDDFTGFTPLTLASFKGYKDIVKLLIKNKVNINDTENNTYTPLMISIMKKHFYISSMILDAGVQINKKNDLGETAIFQACQHGNLYLVKKMIDLGAKIDITDNNGMTPLLISISSNNTNISKLLIENKVNINRANNNGHTAFTYACLNQQKELIKLLLKNGADINHKSDNKTICINYSDNEEVKNFFMKERNFQEIDFNGNKGYVSVTMKTDEELLDEHDQTYLITASILNQTDIVRILIDNGAELNIRDNYGKTALDYAKLFGNNEIVKLLEK